jgi:exodeoxyribonuclease VII large subunit
LPKLTSSQILDEENKLDSIGRIVTQCVPDNILKKGFTITRYKGKILKNAGAVKAGDNIQTVLYEGEIESVITKSKEV